ncbi:MAG: hypothetical protein JWQ27_3208 [Ferruginibacter sp.]|nr:hypothetical protein [Ferruginibacter sp.]
MKEGLLRFEFYLNQLETLLTAAANEPNPALWLFRNNARTPLFMLEGLAKLYGSILKNKKLEKIKERFKLLEDALGAIDYYDAFAKQLATNPAVPSTVVRYLENKTTEKTLLLNHILLSEKWLGNKNTRLKKTWDKLAGINWPDAKKEPALVADFYDASIEEAKVLMLSAAKGFTELETEVHTLRRKLRWLSIYPQAMQGMLQLTDSKPEQASLGSYLSPEIVNSPFNKMPDVAGNNYFLMLEKNYFLALSWMIAELGKIKDDGLQVFAVGEALQELEGQDIQTAAANAATMLGKPAGYMQSLLQRASELTNKFFIEHNLDQLLHGTAAEALKEKEDPKKEKPGKKNGKKENPDKEKPGKKKSKKDKSKKKKPSPDLTAN